MFIYISIEKLKGGETFNNFIEIGGKRYKDMKVGIFDNEEDDINASSKTNENVRVFTIQMPPSGHIIDFDLMDELEKLL